MLQDEHITRSLRGGRWAAAALVFLTFGLAADGRDNKLDPDERAVVLRLVSGHEVSGRILADGFDQVTGIVMRRDDNGGRLTLRWDQIHPDDVDAVNRMYGFVGDDLPSILIDVLEVETTSGYTVSGINRGWKDKKLQLEKGGVIYPVPEAMVKRQRTIKVDALEYADPLEVFVQNRQADPPTEAVDWFNLGLLAEALTLYPQAAECYEEALTIDPDFSKKAVIGNNLARLKVKEKESEATAALAKIANDLRQGKFLAALEGCDAFLAQWPTSQQMGELQTLKSRIVAKRHESLIADCRTNYFTALRDITRQKVREKELTLGEALNWSEDSLAQAVVERLAAYHKTTDEEIEQVWSERGTGASPHTFSYSGGTWLLGQAAAAGMGKKKGEEEGADKPAGGDKSEPQTIDEIIAKKLKEKQDKNKQSKKRADQGQQLYEVPPTEEEWWLSAGPSEREAFLIAWSSEKVGNVEVVNVYGRACNLCEGKGILDYFQSSLKSSDGSKKKRDWEPCPRCKGLGFDRIVEIR